MATEFRVRLGEIARVLQLWYCDFDHHNLKDPLDELLFIICSTRTAERGYRSTYEALRVRYPTNAALARAGVDQIAAVLKPGGLAHKKATQISESLLAITEQFGEPSLERLREWPDEQCEEFLLSLPGVGKKVARCVMLYSLGRAVFPVDEHCWRISRRLGWIRATRRNRSGSPRDEDRLQAKIPPSYRHSLHVNMISLGREFCTSRNPRCFTCPIREFCRRVGIRAVRQ